MTSSLPNNGVTYADNLRTLAANKAGMGKDKIPDFEPPQLINMERKLQILKGEWFEESYFKNDEVAALYSFYQPTQGPFIIVPSFTTPEVQSEFTL